MKKLFLLALLAMLTLILNAEQYTVNDNQNEVNIINSNGQQTILEMTLGHFNREAVRISNETYWALNLKKEGFTMETGMPQLPYISRSLIIPGTARMSVNTLESEYTDLVMPIAPSKGNLTRDINPNDVPWTFDSFYQSAGSYPESVSRLSEPFIIRDYRGITVYFQPFVYFPATQTLRVYTRLRLSVDNTGIDNTNAITSAKTSASSWFDNVYKGMFLNYSQAKYPVLDDHGRMLIINNSMFNTTIQPFVDWKRQKGFTVDVVDITVAGPSATQLKTYIQNQYDLNNDLAFVQIIGDHAQVPSLSSGGGASDPSFALTAGIDSYPDIFIGRFSAQTTTDLETQVTRTIYYERDMQSGNAWLAKGLGIASNEGGGGQGDLGESDQTHIDNIRTDLLNYGYTSVDQVYQAQGATQAMITNDVNEGRSMINYCGHGSDTSWGTTGFSNSQVNQLTNNNKLPFIVSVACVNGNFANLTCFAEAWLRARDSVTGNPRGSVVFWGSSINQSWNPPMRAEDEVTDLMTTNQKNTIGGLFFNGASKMIEVYSSDGINMYKTWNIFGDASLQIRNTDPQPMTAQYPTTLFLGASTYVVQTNPGAWVTLYSNGVIYGTAIANETGLATLSLTTIPTQPMDLTLTITAYNRVTNISTIQVLPNNGPYVQIDNQIVSDDNNNRADFGETINFDLALTNVGASSANEITATISTSDPYITITDNTELFGNINVNQISTSSDGYTIVIANNVPDQHQSLIHVAIAQGDSISWEFDTILTLNAPSLATGTIVISDAAGNNNGRIDAGETVSIIIPVINNGHSTAINVLSSLLISNAVNYILTPVTTSFPTLDTGATAQMMYEVTFSSQIPAGTQVEFLFMGVAGEYTTNQTINAYVGLVLEDFESGTMTSYPWIFAGGNWTNDNTAFHNGAYSSKSADINDSQTTSMTVSMQVPTDGYITFWKKISSEQSYDYLRFSINDSLCNEWSGSIDWSQESFLVNQGLATFKWEYAKDYMMSSGSDCAWVDDITFPSTGGISGTPVFTVSTQNINFGAHAISEFTPVSFTINNTGDAIMIGTVTGNEIFKVKTATDDDYSVTRNYIVPAGASFDFEVMIFTTHTGTANADLVITSDAPTQPFINIPVTANVLSTGNGNENEVTITALKGNYPNPFNPETTVYFSLKADSKVNLDIYNLLGQKVRTLANGLLQKGNHSLKWNGKDDAGRNVGSGIYFYKMKTDNYTSIQKMILMK